MLPLDFLRGVFERRLARDGARPLFATLSGAHLYGFPSVDSDYDVRGVFLRPLPEVLSLFPPRETIEQSGVEEGREIDLVAHEAGKFFHLLLRKNGYVLEQIFSPIVILGGPPLEELRDIAGGCVTRHVYHHYRGFAENHLKMLAGEPRKKVKTLLYLYRILFSGIHLLRTGRVEAHLPTLAEGRPEILELIAAKQRELATLEPGESEAHERRIAELRARLDDAYAASTLDEEPRRARDLDAFLVRLRLAT